MQFNPMDVVDYLIRYGIFAILFGWLLQKTNKRNEVREDRYQETITENQKVIKEQAVAFTSMSGDIKEIKYMLGSGGRK